MNPCSDEADEVDIEWDEVVLLDDYVGESQPFNEVEAAMEPLEIDWYPANSSNRHRASR